MNIERRNYRTLQNLHEPYAKLSKWQIKRARAHARRNGPGFAVTKPKNHRISLNMNKVDHFVDFINRPYFHQDVAFGMRKAASSAGPRCVMGRSRFREGLRNLVK